MSCYIYARVSHRSSKDSGLSIEEQIQQCQAYIRERLPDDKLGEHSFEDAPGVFCDRAISGWSKKFRLRPAGNALASVLKAGDHIVCYSIDRLARNVRDYCNTIHDFEQAGVIIHYICEQIDTSTALGKLQAHYRAAAAQYMSDQISERTREAKLIKSITRDGKHEKQKTRREWLSGDLDFRRPDLKEKRKVGTVYRYERVSTVRQYTSGLGLEAQSRRNEAYARRIAEQLGANYYEEAFCDPAESAFRTPLPERRAGRELLAKLQAGDDLVIYKLDRAWRNTIEALTMINELTARGVFVHLVYEGIRTDMAQGCEWIGFLAAMAQLESTYRSRRVREAFDRCRALGRPVGQIPTGLKTVEINGKHKMIPDRKAIIELAIAWVMKNRLNMSHKDMDDVLFAFHCQKNKLKPILKNRKLMRPDRALARADTMISVLPHKYWEDCIEEAVKRLTQGVDPKYIPDGKWPNELSLATVNV